MGTRLGSAVIVSTPSTRRLYAERWAEILRAVGAQYEVVADLEVCDPGAVRAVLERYRPDLLVAAGGDGTTNLCVQAVGPADVLAVLPLGTANDLRRGLQSGLASVQSIDRIEVNQSAFCTTGGFGIPGTIAARVNRLRSSRLAPLGRAVGRHIYALVAADLVLRHTSAPQRVAVDWVDADTGEEHHLSVRTNTLFVTNQSTFGGSLGVVSAADNSDGCFEICVLKSRSRWRDMAVMGRIAMASDQPESDAHVVRARSAVIHTAEAVPFFGDGEILMESDRFELRMNPGAIGVLDVDWGLV